MVNIIYGKKINNMDKIDTFKKYCEITKKQNNYGVLYKDGKGGLYVETFSKNIIKHIAYQHRDNKLYFNLIGEYVELSYATCGYTKKCQVGKPQQKCVDDGIYSLNKCAVVFLEKLDIDKVRYSLNHSEFLSLVDLM